MLFGVSSKLKIMLVGDGFRSKINKESRTAAGGSHVLDLHQPSCVKSSCT